MSIFETNCFEPQFSAPITSNEQIAYSPEFMPLAQANINNIPDIDLDVPYPPGMDNSQTQPKELLVAEELCDWSSDFIDPSLFRKDVLHLESDLSLATEEPVSVDLTSTVAEEILTTPTSSSTKVKGRPPKDHSATATELYRHLQSEFNKKLSEIQSAS